MTRVHLISMRPPDMGGTGDARRAANIIAALDSRGIEVHTIPLLKDGSGLVTQLINRPDPRIWSKAVRGVFGQGRLPLQVALGQALASAASPPLELTDFYLYVTSRIVPNELPARFAVDFVDSLAENARQRARGASNYLSRRFWMWEAKRMAAWESKVAEAAAVSFSVSADDAELIGPAVTAIPIDFDLPNSPHQLSIQPDLSAARHLPSIIFPGSLFYRPNEEAAEWLIRELLPTLRVRGWNPGQLVIAGRRPRRKLLRLAQAAGIEVKADVPDLLHEMSQADVVLAPIKLGAGVQTKVLNAAMLGLPILMTPRANRGLDLLPSATVRVVDRDARSWADALHGLLHEGRRECGELEKALAKRHSTAIVRKQWAESLCAVLEE